MPHEQINTDDAHVIVTWGNPHAPVGLKLGVPNCAELLLKVVNEWLADAGMPTIDQQELTQRLAATGRLKYRNGPYLAGFITSISDPAAVSRLARVLRRARRHTFTRPSPEPQTHTRSG